MSRLSKTKPKKQPKLFVVIFENGNYFVSVCCMNRNQQIIVNTSPNPADAEVLSQMELQLLESTALEGLKYEVITQRKLPKGRKKK